VFSFLTIVSVSRKSRAHPFPSAAWNTFLRQHMKNKHHRKSFNAFSLGLFVEIHVIVFIHIPTASASNTANLYDEVNLDTSFDFMH
jgi:hypothetical protein